MIIELVLSICLCGALFSLYMLVRNNQTFKEVTKVREAIFKKDKNGKFINTFEISDLLHKQNSIATYEKIFYTVWKRPSSFYKEFLKEIETKNQEREAKIEREK